MDGSAYDFTASTNKTATKLSDINGFPVKYIIIIVIGSQIFLVFALTVCGRCRKKRRKGARQDEHGYDATEMGVMSRARQYSQQSVHLKPYGDPIHQTSLA